MNVFTVLLISMRLRAAGSGRADGEHTGSHCGPAGRGIDPERSVLFNQSCVPQHAELAWIFNCVARLGWLNRMTNSRKRRVRTGKMPLSGSMLILH